MIRYSTKVYTADHLREDIISPVSQGIRRLILKTGPPWLFVKAGECQVVGTDKHKEYWKRKKKQPGALTANFQYFRTLQQVATTAVLTSYMGTKPEHDSQFVAQLP